MSLSCLVFVFVLSLPLLKFRLNLNLNQVFMGAHFVLWAVVVRLHASRWGYGPGIAWAGFPVERRARARARVHVRACVRACVREPEFNQALNFRPKASGGKFKSPSMIYRAVFEAAADLSTARITVIAVSRTIENEIICEQRFENFKAFQVCATPRAR